MKSVEGHAVIVTGGASGLGAATALRFREAGALVGIMDRDVARGEQLAADLGAAFAVVDVTSQASVEEGFATLRTVNGQERILVNCAGIGDAAKTAGRSKDGTIRAFPMDMFERVIGVNLTGTFRCISLSAAGMLSLDPLDAFGERGAIICTASVAAVDGQIGQAAYSASKAAIVGLTLPVARDLMSEGIRINTIIPGLFDTPLMQSVSESVMAALAASVPFPKRLGFPAEYAELALQLATNGYMNGESIRIDGAIRMAPR